MRSNLIIEEEILQGQPLRLETELKLELIQQLQQMNGNNYENICDNLRLLADVFEEIEDHINDDLITFKWNPMGAWYRVEEEESEESEVI